MPSRRPESPGTDATRALPGWGMLAPTGRGWGMLLLAALLWVAWRLAGLREIGFLAVLCAALPVVCLLLVALEVALARIHVGVGVTLATPSPGERTRLVVSASHRLPFVLPVDLRWSPDPGGRLALAVPPIDEGVRHHSLRSPLDIRSGPGARTGIDLVARARGATGVTLSALVVGDGLGMARCRVRADRHVEVVVLPALRPVDEVDDPVDDDDGVSVVAGLGEPGGNLREHRDGDPLRLIHWKQTARQGRLLVNVPESSLGAHLRIHLVTDSRAYTRGGFEAAVSLAASLAVRALGRGDEVEIGIGPAGGDARPVRSATQVLRGLALVEEDEGEDGSRERAGGAPGSPPLSGLVVTGRATPDLLGRLEAGGGGTVLLTGGGADDRSGFESDPGDDGSRVSGVPGWRWHRDPGGAS